MNEGLQKRLNQATAEVINSMQQYEEQEISFDELIRQLDEQLPTMDELFRQLDEKLPPIEEMIKQYGTLPDVMDIIKQHEAEPGSIKTNRPKKRTKNHDT